MKEWVDKFKQALKFFSYLYTESLTIFASPFVICNKSVILSLHFNEFMNGFLLC